MSGGQAILPVRWQLSEALLTTNHQRTTTNHPATIAPMPHELPHYSLGATEAEHRRLIDLASHEEQHVVDACRRAGIGEGATVLDLGCGPLGGLAALAGVVGRAGTVIGIDASAG